MYSPCRTVSFSCLLLCYVFASRPAMIFRIEMISAATGRPEFGMILDQLYLLNMFQDLPLICASINNLKMVF